MFLIKTWHLLETKVYTAKIKLANIWHFKKPIESLLKQCKICKLMHISWKISYQLKTFNVSQFYVGLCCYFTSICNHFW